MKTITTLILVLALAATVTACGRRGDPEPPGFTQSQ